MRDDAFATTWAVWSEVGFAPGLVVFGACLLFFILLDCTVGRRIKGRGQIKGRFGHRPADRRDGPDGTFDTSYDGSGEAATPGDDGS